MNNMTLLQTNKNYKNKTHNQNPKPENNLRCPGVVSALWSQPLGGWGRRIIFEHSLGVHKINQPKQTRNTQKLTRANVYKSFAFPPHRTTSISFETTGILNGILNTPHLKRAKHVTSLNWSPKFALYFSISSHLGSPEAWQLQVRGLCLFILPSTFSTPTASAEARWVGMVWVTGWQSPCEQRRALHTVAWGTFGGFQFFPVSTPLPWHKNHPLLGFPGIPEKGRKYCLCPPPPLLNNYSLTKFQEVHWEGSQVTLSACNISRNAESTPPLKTLWWDLLK